MEVKGPMLGTGGDSGDGLRDGGEQMMFVMWPKATKTKYA